MNEPDINVEIFDTALADDEEGTNKRTAIRYIRSDIAVTITKPGINLTKFIPVKLIDISSKGATIEFRKKIAINQKVILHLLFQDNRNFTISAQIIHLAKNAYKNKNKNKHGLKFDHINDELGDYLLASQQELKFK
jgi:hypothetical protein